MKILKIFTCGCTVPFGTYQNIVLYLKVTKHTEKNKKVQYVYTYIVKKKII